uniref:NifU family protein n=1 Tax=Sulfurovum sp. TaxID=1969726 RepID=UPI002868312C
WAVNTHEDTIVKARYTYDGVPSGLAVNHMLALLLTKKSIPEVDGISYIALEKFLRDNPKIEALPSSERYAITFALDAAKLAVKEYISKSLSHEEETIPCKDSPMSSASIKESIALHNIETLETLVEYTKAGSSDSSCKENLLASIDAQQKALAEQLEAENSLSEAPFKDLSPEHKVVAVEIAIDNTVRDFLIMDGGDIDILNVKEDGDMYVVYISYLGACSSCSSSGTGTLYAIQNALRDKLDPNIHVVAI